MVAPARSGLRRQGLRLEYLTIGWNVIEGIVAVAAGIAAGSIALVGFGFDSSIEVVAATVVVWHFRAEERGGGVDEARERRALRLIAVTFFVLAAYVAVEAVRDLVIGAEPETSRVGIVVACLSLLVMPTLALAKRRVGRQLGSPTLIADSTETFLCSWLSAILLVGLVLNATVGWAWADPVAGLAIAWLALREGREAWRGDECA
ncbi:MAG: cation diffusion facilitator family transporter [Acidimicrobiia bacterium]